MNTTKETRIANAVDILAGLRAQHAAMERLPDHVRPQTPAEAYEIQARLARAAATDGMHWKVSASGPLGPAAAPVFGDRILTSPATVGTANRLETEIALKLGRDLPCRPERPYSRQEVRACVEAFAIAFELVDWRLTAGDLSFPERLADCFANDGMVIGDPAPLEVLSASPVTQTTLFRDGEPEPFTPVDIDPVGSLLAYANAGGDRLGGFKAGQWVLTGSMTGMQACGSASAWKACWADISEVCLTLA
ncbi:hypothetical protein [Roseibium sp. Sym1]|uniref:hypothetical protein n=1 Tax=Roseibium sp. Sym1 TaxID=3016006 RepID=UPI0022B5BE39|nr:hypothetical protein [Roseibium sp. Sym1]